MRRPQAAHPEVDGLLCQAIARDQRLEDNLVTIHLVDDPLVVARAKAQRERVKRNSDWLQSHWDDLLPQARGKYVVVAGQQAFVADTSEEAWAMAWLFDPDVLMWIQIATGFFGALTLIHCLRVLGRKLGRIMETSVHFSPKGGCQDALVQELRKAHREILVQAYSFTADPLTFALVDAKKRGVKVEILLDRSNEVEKYSDLHILLEQGLDPLA